MHVVDHLFADVAAPTADALESARRPRVFAPGEEMIDCDRVPDYLYCLLEGRAKVWRPTHDGRLLVLHFYGPGEVAGIPAVARNRPNPAAVSALTTVRADSWPIELVRTLMRSDPLLAQNVARLLSKRVSLLVDRLADVTTGRVDQQLARVLLRLSSEDGAWDESRVSIPITRQNLADMTGTTLPTASRILSHWGERGLVESARGEITVTDPYQLAALADLADPHD